MIINEKQRFKAKKQIHQGVTWLLPVTAGKAIPTEGWLGLEACKPAAWGRKVWEDTGRERGKYAVVRNGMAGGDSKGEFFGSLSPCGTV